MVQCVGLRGLFGRLAVLGIYLIASANANAGLIITSTGDQAYKDFGATYQSVFWQEGRNQAGNLSFRQSGVLIDSQWILTSAHGVLEVDNNLSSVYRDLQVGAGNFLNDRQGIRSVSNVLIHPGYGGAAGSGYDLALLRLQDAILTIPAELYEGPITVGLDSDIVGYGRLQYLNESTSILTGDKRGGNNVIDLVGNPSAYYVQTSIESPFLPTYRPLGMAGTGGDSGGGLFIDGQLAGITSFSDTVFGFNGYGTYTGYSLIDRDWVNSTMASYQAIPEPGSLLLTFAATSLFALKRRRLIA
jgi:hypothetical protein